MILRPKPEPATRCLDLTLDEFSADPLNYLIAAHRFGHTYRVSFTPSGATEPVRIVVRSEREGDCRPSGADAA